MKLAGLGKLYTILYDDKMDVYRTEKQLNSDYTTIVNYTPDPVYTGIKCRISFESDDIASDSAVDSNPVRYNPKIFCERNVQLRAGDYVVVRRYADDRSVCRTYEGHIAEPSLYTTHQEVFLRIDKEA